MLSSNLLVYTFLALLHPFLEVRSELFTAVADLEPLLETHKRIIDDLDHYIESEEERLHYLKRKLVLYKNEHERAMEDISNYLGNPLNAFTLIKRLTSDLNEIEKSIISGTDYIKNITTSHKDVKYPTEEDMNGAAEALVRLQDTYNLDPNELAQGEINGISYSYPLSSSDCFQIGKSIYGMGQYKYAIMWIIQALNKFDTDEDHFRDFSKADMLEYIGFSYYLQDDIEQALHWTKELLRVDPNHIRASGNIPLYEKALAERRRVEMRRRRGEIEDDPAPVEKAPAEKQPERINYEALCRGDFQIAPAVEKELKCYYSSENHPFLKLARFKVEEVYKDPDVYVYYDVMSDSEIQFLKDSAKPRFQRATVHNPETGQLVPAPYRISKSAWLKDEESGRVSVISQRASDMTGLTVSTAEELQVVNYGIGGHYEPHFDFARMSDVDQGGATVFTELGAAVHPSKGAALVWRNLLPSGAGDYSTRHAACPVLAGSKWVANKWIHEAGQELLAPCTLEQQDEGVIKPHPKPVPASFSTR